MLINISVRTLLSKKKDYRSDPWRPKGQPATLRTGALNVKD